MKSMSREEVGVSTATSHGGMLRSVVKAFLPRSVRERLAVRRRERAFHSAMQRLLADPMRVLSDTDPLLRSLAFGWGNEGWSANEGYLRSCVREALDSDGPVLECGSGLSTIVLAAVLRGSGRSIWSLEHHDEWRGRIRATLVRYGLQNAHVCEAPIVDYGEFSWYRPPFEKMPYGFGLVVCDGPPSVTPGGRYGLVPVMAKRLSGRFTLLLDDAIREAEQETAQRWATELSASVETLGERPYFRIRPTQS